MKTINRVFEKDLPRAVVQNLPLVRSYLSTDEHITMETDLSKLCKLNWSNVQYSQVFKHLHYTLGKMCWKNLEYNQKSYFATKEQWKSWAKDVSSGINYLEVSCQATANDSTSWDFLARVYFELLEGIQLFPMIILDISTKFPLLSPEERCILEKKTDQNKEKEIIGKLNERCRKVIFMEGSFSKIK